MRRVPLLLKVVIGIYAVSFVLPTLPHDLGVEVFAKAWVGLALLFSQSPLGAILVFAPWLANPAFWCGAYFCARQRWTKAVWTGTAASLLALSSIPFFVSQSQHGNIGLGYFVWLASMFLLTGVGLIGLLRAHGRGVRDFTDLTPPT